MKRILKSRHRHLVRGSIAFSWGVIVLWQVIEYPSLTMPTFYKLVISSTMLWDAFNDVYQWRLKQND